MPFREACQLGQMLHGAQSCLVYRGYDDADQRQRVSLRHIGRVESWHNSLANVHFTEATSLKEECAENLRLRCPSALGRNSGKLGIMIAATEAGDVARPPLKWAGGKRWQIPHLLPIWTSLAGPRRLVEPFCGGLAVALGLRPKEAVLNDTNPHLINFYRWLKTGLTFTLPMKNDEALFYRHRERFNTLICSGNADTREAAELFYFLNRTAYNGLCRFNRRGEFNTPFGRYKAINYATDFIAYKPVLAPWEFLNTDFQNMKFRSGDFVYADPPYDVEFTSYSQGGFSWDDQVRTAEFLASLDCPVVLVNQSTPRINSLYRGLGYSLRRVDAPRRISCTGDRTPAREVIATRNI